MKFSSQICTTKEQSERLLALGLKAETADMCWFNDMQKPFCAPYKCFADKAQDMKWVIFPAWSLHRLIEMYHKTCIFWTDCLDDPYEAMIGRIADKIKWGELNKEYLEE